MNENIIGGWLPNLLEHKHLLTVLLSERLPERLLERLPERLLEHLLKAFVEPHPKIFTKMC